MCGIIGYLGDKQVVPILIDGLRRLEYRGYDSAGVAVVRNGQIERRRSAGKLANLEESIQTEPLEGIYGIGHTRWATHGRPTEENAHPHQDCSGKIVVVHNGIIENYLDLKRELIRRGHKFVTETDSEVIAHLLEDEMKTQGASARLEAPSRSIMLPRCISTVRSEMPSDWAICLLDWPATSAASTSFSRAVSNAARSCASRLRRPVAARSSSKVKACWKQPSKACSENGFSMKSTAPIFIARTAIGTSPWPVITTTGQSTFRSCRADMM